VRQALRCGQDVFFAIVAFDEPECVRDVNLADCISVDSTPTAFHVRREGANCLTTVQTQGSARHGDDERMEEAFLPGLKLLGPHIRRTEPELRFHESVGIPEDWLEHARKLRSNS
jgi:hypothetical protein